MPEVEKKFELKEPEALVGERFSGYVKIENVLYSNEKKTKGRIDLTVPSDWSTMVATVVEVDEGCSLPTSSWWGPGKYQIKLVGRRPPIETGIAYRVIATFVNDARYGYQYNIDQLAKPYKMDTQEERELYMRIALGSTMTELLMLHLRDPWEALVSEDRDALKTVPGIGDHRSSSLIKKFKSNLDMSGQMNRLLEYGLSAVMIEKLNKQYRSPDTVLFILENNPYALIEEVQGIGWEKADAMAITKGYNPCGEDRLAAFVNYFLSNQANTDGHSYVDLDLLVNAIRGIAPLVNMDFLKVLLRKWTGMTFEAGYHPWLYYEPDTHRIGLLYHRKLEEKIAYEIHRVLDGARFMEQYSDEEIAKGIAESEADNGFPYTEEQQQGIISCLKNSMTIISGFAGVGKSYTMRAVTALLKKRGLTFAQCALSGKASSNLSEITGAEGYTIHRLLGYDPATGGFTFHSGNPLPFDAIILDELSLVGGEIFLNLVEAIRQGCRLIMLGDPNQLEAIGLANLLKDCLNSYVVPSVRLTKIHRQAARSGIITESLKASAGDQIVDNLPTVELRGELQDLKVVTYSDQILSQDTLIAEYEDLFFNRKIKPKDIMVVVPMRTRGDISCFALNERIQSMVNGCALNNDATVSAGGYTWVLRVGDKVLITKNNYQDCVAVGQEGVKKADGKAPGPIPIFNGNTGFIKFIDQQRGWMCVDLVQQGEVMIPSALWNTVELGYAMTAHKCQGSAAPYVIVGLDMGAYTLLSKEWLYTSLTRAKKYCVFVSQISAARRAVGISRVTIKHTWLQELLIELQEKKRNGDLLIGDEKGLGWYRYHPEVLKEAAERAAQANASNDDADLPID